MQDGSKKESSKIEDIKVASPLLISNNHALSSMRIVTANRAVPLLLGLFLLLSCSISTARTVEAIDKKSQRYLQATKFDGDIGACQSFAVFGSTRVFFDGARSFIPVGNAGISPGTDITATTGTVEQVLTTGTKEVNTASAIACSNDQKRVISSGKGSTCTVTSVSALEGLTLVPGVYCFGSFSLASGGAVTFDGTGVTQPQWVFVAGTTFITDVNAKVNFINGYPSQLYWVLGTSATIGANNNMKGNIMASAAITFNTGAVHLGQAIAGSAITCVSNCQITSFFPPTGTYTDICYLYTYVYVCVDIYICVVYSVNEHTCTY